MAKQTNGSKPPVAAPKLAYQDERFLDSADARALRILSEYLSLIHISEPTRPY